MAKFSPKIEIINHFDNLINRIDVDIEESLEKFNDQQLIELLTSSANNRRNFINRSVGFTVEFFDTIDSSKPNPDSWPESMKVVDYLKQIRMKTIEQLRKEQEETLGYYNLNSARFKSEQASEKSIDELRSELFADKFYFQVHLNQPETRLWAFSVFTFVTDFYLSPSFIGSLEKLINSEKEPFGRDPDFDDNMVLIGLLYKYFIANLLNFPDRLIHVSKQDVLNIKSINFNHEFSSVNLTSSSTIDLSKLEDLHLHDRTGVAFPKESVMFNIEGLSSLDSLKLTANTAKISEFSIKNLPSLTILHFTISGAIDEDIVTRLFDQLQLIQVLYLKANLSYFNLDSLVNLRKLSLSGTINEYFNFELFKNLCNQLEDIKIHLTNIDEKTFIKLFDNCYFPYLVDFSLCFINIRILKKEFINRFPMLRKLAISNCNIEVIESDSFSNLEQLCYLDLSGNQIDCIEENAFSKLKNLKEVHLNQNRLRRFDPKFVGLRESAKFYIRSNYTGFTRQGTFLF